MGSDLLERCRQAALKHGHQAWSDPLPGADAAVNPRRAACLACGEYSGRCCAKIPGCAAKNLIPWKFADNACPLKRWDSPATLPGISCYMPTRALPPGMHDEAVACFLAQDYPGPKELVVYSNDPGLVLSFAHPEVRVVNEDRAGRSLGALFNATIALCQYPLLACWEDDDIRLPGHLSAMWAALGEFDAVRPTNFWHLEQNAIKEWYGGGPVHSAWLLRRAALAAAGGYPVARSTDCDQYVWAALEKAGPVRAWECRPDETTLLYRWDSGSVHLSGFGIGDSVMDSAGQLSAHGQLSGAFASGQVTLAPALKTDYAAMVRDYCNEHQETLK
jgi:hypothetical protein